MHPPSVSTGRLAHLPVSLFGSVMGYSGLALAWRLAASEFGLPGWIGEALAFVAVSVFLLLTLCYAIKCIESPEAVRAEFAHPVAVNFFGTPIISLLLLPAVVAPYSAALTKALWLIGTVSIAELRVAGREPVDERSTKDRARDACLDDSHRRNTQHLDCGRYAGCSRSTGR